MDRFVRVLLLWMTFFGGSLSAVGQSDESAAFDESALEFFEREVRPILASRCLECHGDQGTPKGGLRLDSRAGLLKGGDTGPGVILDKPAESLFVSSINYGDIYQMPPKSKLPSSEIAVLTKWVEMGLPWPKEAIKAGTVKPFDLATRVAEHWCWQPLKSVEPPAVAKAQWPISDVDRFILARLESRSLAPAPPADRRTLLRRVYFDLIGLPPSPQEVEQFVQDPDPRALEIVVDRLLGSVHFGERWGRHWLDLTRYAETRGHEFEPLIPNAWQYRDYVIRALNADVPFDRFLTEQIAGDLIEPRWRVAALSSAPTPPLPINESLLGTGFWFLGEEVHSPVDIRKDETDRIDNRIDVMTKTFLGLTVGCARCHDHKFDAISQRDYYALAGFAISGSYRQVRIDTFEQHRQVAIKLYERREQARRRTARSLVENSKSVLEKLDQYCLAAKQVLDAGVLVSDISSPNSTLAAGSDVISRLATERELDPTLFLRWCRELKVAKEDAGHPLHGLCVSSSAEPANAAGQGSTEAPPAAPRDQSQKLAGLVVDFGHPTFDSPMQDGVSFGLRPVIRGQLVVTGTPEKPHITVAKVGGWERDLFWKNNKLTPGTEIDHGTLGAWQFSGRMVRSPEFTLTKRNAWYLVRGSVRAYASVNSHLIVVGPLHGSVFREFKHSDDQWHWVSHDLAAYSGHRMHIEFAPADDGPCAIAMVVQSDEVPTLQEQNGSVLRLAETKDKAGDEPTTEYVSALRDVVRGLVADDDKQLVAPDRAGAETSQNRLEPRAVAVQTGTSRQVSLADWFVTHPSLFSLAEFKIPDTGLVEAEAALQKEVRWESSLAPAMLEGNGVEEFLLIRGNSNTPKAPVSRRFLEAFSSAEHAAPIIEENDTDGRMAGSGRYELAQDMLRSPLVPRVAVNRIWHHLFGSGIVSTVDNMGVLGLPPSHPELLDYLALQFVQNGWSTKKMIRSLILSRTYQMSSHPTDADALDPKNELWHRMPIKRLEGEIIRDSLLAVSGRLDPTPFGPSIPIHLTEFMQGRGRPGTSGPLDGNGRRSIYIAVRRNFLSPMMLAFDTPSPFSTVGRRTISNVPAQALILMNDPFVIEQANRWAERLLSEASLTTEQRLDRLYLTAFARHPCAAEISEAIAFLDSQGAGQSENQRAAWSHLCHVMVNVKEFVFVE